MSAGDPEVLNIEKESALQLAQLRDEVYGAYIATEEPGRTVHFIFE